MRLSTQQFFIQNLTNVQQSNSQIFKYQQQLSTGQKLSNHQMTRWRQRRSISLNY